MSTCLIFDSLRRFAVVAIGLLLFMAMPGCYNQSVRHLTSDVGLIKAGETTRQEALSLLGEPDSIQKVSATTEEWIYQEEDKSLLQKTPLMGGAFAAKGYRTVVLTLQGDLVIATRYGSYDKDEFDWKDDYTWKDVDQKTEKKTGQ